MLSRKAPEMSASNHLDRDEAPPDFATASSSTRHSMYLLLEVSTLGAQLLGLGPARIPPWI